VAHVPPGDRPVGSTDTGSGPIFNDEGVDKKQVTRLVIVGVLAIGALIFIVQNSERVETTFLFFSVETRLWVGLIIALVLGAVLGQLGQVLWRRRKGADKDD
jgi:uncharacterized integral membrane protein